MELGLGEPPMRGNPVALLYQHRGEPGGEGSVMDAGPGLTRQKGPRGDRLVDDGVQVFEVRWSPTWNVLADAPLPRKSLRLVLQVLHGLGNLVGL